MIKLCAPTDEAGYSLDEAIATFKKSGIHLAEIRGIVDGDINKNVLQLSDTEIEYLRQKLEDNDIKVWSISSPIGKRDFALPIELFYVLMEKAIRVAKGFGTQNIRIFSFFNHGNNVDEVVRRLQLCVDMGKEAGMTVLLENEKGSYASTAETTLELLDKVDGLEYVYDASNFIQAAEPAELTLSTCLDKATFIHFKDGVHAHGDADICPVGQGEANIEKLLNMLEGDKVLSLEHHLCFAEEGQDYAEIKDRCEYTYPHIVDAFDDAAKHARIMLDKCGYTEVEEGCFEKEAKWTQ